MCNFYVMAGDTVYPCMENLNETCDPISLCELLGADGDVWSVRALQRYVCSKPVLCLEGTTASISALPLLCQDLTSPHVRRSAMFAKAGITWQAI